MKMNRQVIQSIVGFLCILLLLAPITVQAQTKVVVIPLFGDDAKPLKNIVTVAKANGDFKNPVTAVNSITDASADNPYLVVIGPGVYRITQTLQMKEYVDIVGSGENVTKITGAISTGSSDVSSAIISGVSNSALSSLTIENTGGDYGSIALYNNNTSPRVTNVTSTASGGTMNIGTYNISSSPIMNNVTSTASGGVYNYAAWNSSSSPTMSSVTATASGGTDSIGVSNSSSSPIMTNVTATASGGQYNRAVNNDSFSSPTMNNVSATASGGEYNRAVYNFSSSPTMTNVTATASGGTGNNYGVYNYSSASSPKIRRSAIKGDTYGLFSRDSSTAMVSQSTIMGGAEVDGGGINSCVACDDGSGNALDAECK